MVKSNCSARLRSALAAVHTRGSRKQKTRRIQTMKKTYKIEVDCANCANLMEEATRKTPGVASATVNFMTQKMIVEFEEEQDPKTVMKAVLKACKKVEPDCEIEL